MYMSPNIGHQEIIGCWVNEATMVKFRTGNISKPEKADNKNE